MDSRLAGAFDYTRERKVPIRRTPTTTGWREAMTSSWQERRRPFVLPPCTPRGTLIPSLSRTFRCALSCSLPPSSRPNRFGRGVNALVSRDRAT